MFPILRTRPARKSSEVKCFKEPEMYFCIQPNYLVKFMIILSNMAFFCNSFTINHFNLSNSFILV